MKKLTQNEFKLPNAPNINGRKSTIAKALSDGIAPRYRPNNKEYNEYLMFFHKDIEDNFLCAYCGIKSDYLEHFRPLVENKKPTGYGSDIYNLVPSCKTCNEKKKNDYWKTWMNNLEIIGTVHSENHNKRFDNLKKFESWGENKVIHINYENLIGSEIWSKYLKSFEELLTTMDELNTIQTIIRNKVKEKVKTANKV